MMIVLSTTTACDNHSFDFFFPVASFSWGKVSASAWSQVFSPELLDRDRRCTGALQRLGEEDKVSSPQLPCIRWDVHLHLALNKICGTTAKVHQETDTVQRGEGGSVHLRERKRECYVMERTTTKYRLEVSKMLLNHLLRWSDCSDLTSVWRAFTLGLFMIRADNPISTKALERYTFQLLQYL